MNNSKVKKRNLSQEDLFNFSELFKLMKPRVMSLVIFTCAVGLLTSPNLVSTKDAIIGILLVSLGAGAAGALNMWYESDLDALMSRTCLRPIPTGKVNRNQALILGVTLSIISVVALDYFTNRISAGILLLTILFYVFVYTIWLKRRTPQNIVIGGAAGAFPPVIGWTIATGSLSIEPLTFFLMSAKDSVIQSNSITSSNCAFDALPNILATDVLPVPTEPTRIKCSHSPCFSYASSRSLLTFDKASSSTELKFAL